MNRWLCVRVGIASKYIFLYRPNKPGDIYSVLPLNTYDYIPPYDKGQTPVYCR